MPIDYIQEGRKQGKLFPACMHLELRLPQIEREGVTPYLTGIKKGDRNIKALWQFITNCGTPITRKYEPYCAKTGEVCVVLESPIISMQETGGAYQELLVTLTNTNRIEECKDRVIPSNAIEGLFLQETFILNGIVRAIQNYKKKNMN